MKRKYKKSLMYVLVLTLVGGVFTGGLMIKNSLQEEKKLIPVNDQVLEKVIPVSSTKKTIIRPYTDSNVAVLNSFYDYKSDNDKQLNSIIYYDNTYMQNTGNIYGKDDKFDVIAIADGEVIKVEDGNLFGKVVTIKHNDNLVSVYRFLETTSVTPNKVVKQGDKIGESGISNITDNTKYQLYFELLVHDSIVDAENYYGKDINEI